MSGDRPSWNFSAGDEISPGRSALSLLGGGHRCEAWLARNESRDQRLVIKLLRPNHVDNERSRRALAREARAVERVTHPSIVRLLDASVETARPLIALEHIDGPRLSTFVRRTRALTFGEVTKLGQELASALAVIHGAGLVHMDVKPKNVILGQQGTLIDFGMARTLAEVRTLDSPIGTTAYMSPEQCRADTICSFGPAGDVWGLGVTLYEAASRSLPFPKTTEQDVYPQTHLTPAPLPVDAPRPLAELIMSALAYEPADRPTASDLAADLERLSAP